MANAVFTSSPSSKYDDQPEVRYHFPRTYLNVVQASRGDWIVYYEPRRTSGPSSSGGRSAYFAIACVREVVPDADSPDHFYALISDYLEFDNAVPFSSGEVYLEPTLMKPDGSTNKGAFGRSVRSLDPVAFRNIVTAGFSRELSIWERAEDVDSSFVEREEKSLVTQLVSRRFRDAAFRHQVRSAYENTCAVTGLRLVNGGGRPEVQAAHIRPVEEDGPDTVRNGLALTSTIHWMFDRGLIAVDDQYRLLVSNSGIPRELAQLVRHGATLRIPSRQEMRPHPGYLNWHRVHRFKG